jgi:hypothetical protein
LIYKDTRSFRAALQRIGREVDQRYAAVLRATMIALLVKVAYRTPIRTGRAAGSWSIGRGNPGSFMVPEGQSSSPEEAIQRASQVSFEYPYVTWYLYNKVPYIERLEYEGWSQQAPDGMLRLSVAELESSIEEFIKNVL